MGKDHCLSRAVARTTLVSIVVIIVVVLQAALLSGSAVAGTKNEYVPRGLGNEKTSLDDATRSFHSPSPVKLEAEGRSFMAYPPSKIAGARPLSVVYLHGAHGRADKGCPWMRPGASDIGWLVCPEAPNAEPMGVASWGADVAEQSEFVKRAIKVAVDNGASDQPGVAVGFSQGSYVAIDILKTGRARFRGLVLLGAEMHPDAKRLQAQGVVRVALGAGRQDAAYASLQEETRRLAAEGIETRFVDLGAVGHTYAAEDAEALRDAIVWAGST